MLKSRILSIFTPGLRATTSEIARSLSADVDTVGRRLRELCAAGKVARLAMGAGKVAWQLSSPQPEGAVDLPAPKLSPNV